MRLFSEFSLAARSLARSPVLVIVAVGSLALGIGANATIFNFVNAIEFRPLPFPEPDRLVDVSEDNPQELCAGCAVGTSWSTFQLWRGTARSFAGLGAYHEEAYALAGEGEPERVGGAAISASVFPVLGVAPILGRGISPADDVAGAAPVILIGYGLWIRRYGGDSTLIGKIGIPAAYALTRLMRGLLFSVHPGDPVVFGAVALLLAAISVLASWRPAQRATRVDPLDALRSE